MILCLYINHVFPLQRLNRGMLAKEKYEEMKLPKGVLQKLRLDFLRELL